MKEPKESAGKIDEEEVRSIAKDLTYYNKVFIPHLERNLDQLEVTLKYTLERGNWKE